MSNLFIKYYIPCDNHVEPRFNTTKIITEGQTAIPTNGMYFCENCGGSGYTEAYLPVDILANKIADLIVDRVRDIIEGDY